MNVIKNITTKIAIKCPYTMTPTRIVVHNTANDASARSEVAYMNSNDKYTSFHYAVDDKEIVQGIEENRNSFNAGDGATGKGNRQGISIEICYSKSGGDRFTKAEQNTVELIADILKRYNWGIDKVTKHQDYSGKYCPHRTLDMGWDRFINMIKEELEMREEVEDLKRRVSALEKGEVAVATPTPIVKPTGKPKATPKGYSGSSVIDYLKSIGQDSSFKNRQALAKKHGIKNYIGLANQNSALLRKMRGY